MMLGRSLFNGVKRLKRDGVGTNTLNRKCFFVRLSLLPAMVTPPLCAFNKIVRTLKADETIILGRVIATRMELFEIVLSGRSKGFRNAPSNRPPSQPPQNLSTFHESSGSSPETLNFLRPVPVSFRIATLSIWEPTFFCMRSISSSASSASAAAKSRARRRPSK